MSSDLQICYPQQLISLNNLREVAGSDPRTLEIVGSDFRAVEQVIINDVASPSIQVTSRTRLTAVVPDAVGGEDISSVQVLSNQLTLSGKSLLQFKLSTSTDKVSGMLRLMQLFLKVLLTTPGQDIFSKKIGGGALKNVGKTFGANQGQSIVSDFVISVATTARQITAIQTRDPGLPREERLLSARVVSATFSASQSALIVEVELRNQAGRVGIANLVI